MKKVIGLLAILVMVSGMGFAQTSTNKFTLSGKALGYVAGGTGLVAADAAAEIKFDAKAPYAARTDNIILSTQSNTSNLAVFDLAGLEYTLPASKVFTALKLDPKKFSAYAFGEFGSDTTATGVAQAYSAGGGVNYAVNDSVTANLFEVRYLHGPVPISPSQTVSNGVAVSVGFSFGK